MSKEGTILQAFNTSSDSVIYANVPITSFDYIYLAEAAIHSSGMRSAKICIQNQDRTKSIILKQGEVEKSALHGVKALVIVKKISIPKNWGQVNLVALIYNPDATEIVAAVTAIGE